MMLAFLGVSSTETYVVPVLRKFVLSLYLISIVDNVINYLLAISFHLRHVPEQVLNAEMTTVRYTAKSCTGWVLTFISNWLNWQCKILSFNILLN